MEKVTLQFQTPQDLSSFRKLIEDPCATIIKDLILVCNLTNLEIARAMNSFGAMVIAESKEKTSR